MDKDEYDENSDDTEEDDEIGDDTEEDDKIGGDTASKDKEEYDTKEGLNEKQQQNVDHVNGRVWEVDIREFPWNWGVKPVPTVDELYPDEDPADYARWYHGARGKSKTVMMLWCYDEWFNDVLRFWSLTHWLTDRQP